MVSSYQLLVSLVLLPPSFILTWQCKRTQPAKGYKIKNEKAYIKKYCKLVRGCKVRRHKRNGHIKRPKCTFNFNNLNIFHTIL